MQQTHAPQNADGAMARQTVITAEISAHLLAAQSIAANLSFSAKNLSVIAARIGVEAAGLKVLSGFYDQFAMRAIKATKEINLVAHNIARMTMVRWRCGLFIKKLDWVMARNTEQQAVLNKCYHDVFNRDNHLRQQTLESCQQLSRLLEELLDYMRTMQVIAVNARIEASNLKSHTLQLTQLSTAIDQHSVAILSDITVCQQKLRELL